MTPRNRPAGPARACVLALACAAVAGCLHLVSVERSVEELGRPPDPATLGAVEEGETTRAWLLAGLGPPTEVRELAGEGQLLVYEYRSRRQRRTGVLFLITWGSRVTHVVRHHFEIRDGVVARHWADQTP